MSAAIVAWVGRVVRVRAGLEVGAGSDDAFGTNGWIDHACCVGRAGIVLSQ